jgi:hypothetical protein
VLSNTTPPFCPGEISLDKVAWHGAAYVMPWELPQFYVFPRSHGSNFYLFFHYQTRKKSRNIKRELFTYRKVLILVYSPEDLGTSLLFL